MIRVWFILGERRRDATRKTWRRRNLKTAVWRLSHSPSAAVIGPSVAGAALYKPTNNEHMAASFQRTHRPPQFIVSTWQRGRWNSSTYRHAIIIICGSELSEWWLCPPSSEVYLCRAASPILFLVRYHVVLNVLLASMLRPPALQLKCTFHSVSCPLLLSPETHRNPQPKLTTGSHVNNQLYDFCKF